MPQYTSSQTTPSGAVVVAVLDTTTNIITYTVTTPSGASTSASAPASTPANQATGGVAGPIRTNLINQGSALSSLAGSTVALSAVQSQVNEQARRADATATATNTPPPDNPSPPPPVSNKTDPDVPPPTPAPSTVAPTNTSPAPVTEPVGTQAPADPTPINGLDLPPEPAINGLDLPPPPDTPINGLDLPPPVDEFGGLDQAIERQQASEPVLSEDGEVAIGIRRNTETGEIFYTDPPKGNEEAFDEFAGVDEAIAQQKQINAPFDEFAGVDEAIAQQKQIAINTEGQPVLAEDGSVAEGVKINPETGETYYTAGPKGLSAPLTNTRTNATAQDEVNFKQFEDWRVRLSLAPQSNYLYNADTPGILQPLQATNGILFPYTPNISVQYAAHYDGTEVAHNNYKIYQYKNSSVDSISITCDFTAQDTFEANYLLAVIHFLRSVTKMFYGQDQNPKRGTPPPLCYLTGLGSFQFDAHPLAITNFTYNLPTDVDYIRAGTLTTTAGVNKANTNNPNNSTPAKNNRMVGIEPGGLKPAPQFKGSPGGTVEPTYVPTKMQIQIQAVPIVTRNDISNNFSLKSYATGELLKGMKGNKRISGGIW